MDWPDIHSYKVVFLEFLNREEPTLVAPMTNHDESMCEAPKNRIHGVYNHRNPLVNRGPSPCGAKTGVSENRVPLNLPSGNLT